MWQSDAPGCYGCMTSPCCTPRRPLRRHSGSDVRFSSETSTKATFSHSKRIQSTSVSTGHVSSHKSSQYTGTADADITTSQAAAKPTNHSSASMSRCSATKSKEGQTTSLVSQPSTTVNNKSPHVQNLQWSCSRSRKILLPKSKAEGHVSTQNNDDISEEYSESSGRHFSNKTRSYWTT